MKTPINPLFLVLSGFIFFSGCGGKSNNPVTPATPTLLISLDNSSIDVGQTVNVTLELKDVSDSVFGIGMQLDYNNTLAGFDDSTGLEPGDFLGNDIVQFVRNVDSAAHFSITKLRGQSGSSGSGVIAILTFRGICSGHFAFKIESDNLNLYDSNGNSLDISDFEIGSAELQIN